MKRPEIPPDEAQRLEELRRYRVLDTPPEPPFDDLTRLAAFVFGVPIALVSLVDADRQWFKSRYGLDVPETPRDVSLCGHAVAEGRLLLVPNASRDERFADNPLVAGGPSLRFYAGAPLTTPSGHALGTLCVIDREPQDPRPEQIELLQALARQVMSQLELRRQLIERRELDALKDEFLATASHELRAPLTAIHGSIRLLEREAAAGLPERCAELVRTAGASSTRLLRLVNDMLDLHKIGAGRLELRRSPLDPAEVARSAADELRSAAQARGIHVEVDDRASARVDADPDRLAQILSNLLVNAARHSPEGGRVVLGTRDRPGHVRFEVSDEGPGVAPADRERIFGKFEQAEGAHAGQHGGAGLGLAICRALVEQHGGGIGVENAPGGGSTFWIELPAA